MGLRIRTNIASLNVQRNLSTSSANLALNMEKLSSGKRINKAADDAAGLGVSEVFRAQTRSLAQAKRNASDGISLIQVAEGSMEEVANILVRLRELSVQSATDTIGSRERSYINLEYNQLLNEIDRIGNITEFNGIKLLQGSAANEDLRPLSVHVGAGSGLTPNKDTVELDLDRMVIDTTKSLDLSYGEVVGPNEASGSFKRETAASQIDHIDFALNRINSMRAELGAKQNRLGSAIATIAISHENQSAARSRILDAEFAEQTAELTLNRILQQGGIALQNQANQTPELALSLLR